MQPMELIPPEATAVFRYLVNLRLTMVICQPANRQDYFIGVMPRVSLFLTGVRWMPNNSIILKVRLLA